MTETTETLFDLPAEEAQELVADAKWLFDRLDDLPLPQRVATLNHLRLELAQHSPFQGEPVDCVQWVPAEQVEANDYNPNAVAPPEMKLLHVSIQADGYTQPIVACWNEERTAWEVVDGFHRNRVGREYEDIQQRLQGYLPLVQIRSQRNDRPDRIAATIRHNRARGKHQVVKMSEIVLELKRRNWSDEKIGRELGMDPDEVLRLAQISGLAEAFKDREFSEAWEAELSAEEAVADDVLDALEEEPTRQEIQPEPAEPAKPSPKPHGRAKTSEAPRLRGWEDRTERRTVFHGSDGALLARLHQPPGRSEWRWTVYTAPIQEGLADTKEEAKQEAEGRLSR